jgi:hypothetical protein
MRRLSVVGHAASTAAADTSKNLLRYSAKTRWPPFTGRARASEIAIIARYRRVDVSGKTKMLSCRRHARDTFDPDRELFLVAVISARGEEMALQLIDLLDANSYLLRSPAHPFICCELI